MSDWKTINGALEKGKRERMNIVSKRLVPMTNDNLLYVNSLQVQWAYRYLVALGGDFSFAQMALSEHPAWVGHPTITMN